MTLNRTLITLIAALIVLLGACSQAPAPQDNPEEPTPEEAVVEEISGEKPSQEEVTLTTQGFTSQAQTVDSTGNVGQYTSIVLNSLGNPVISYYDGTRGTPGTPNSAGNGDLKLVVCGNPSCTSGNTITTVDRGTTIYTDDVGRFNSLVLDSKGFPVISYLDRGNGLMLARCRDATCTSKDIKKVNGVRNIIDTSLVLDSKGYPVIAFSTELFTSTGIRGTDIALVRCGSADCSIVTSSTFVERGEYISLALNRNDEPVISYYDARFGDFMVANCSRDCSGKSIQIVDSTGDVGQYSSLVLVPIRDPRGQITGQRPFISYYDVTNGDLKVVYCGNDSCSSGNSIQTVDSTGNVGQHTSLKWNPGTDPTISYYDVTNQDLKVATCDPGSPFAQVPTTPCQEKQYTSLGTVDSTGDVGRDNALAVASNGDSIISYYDATNQDLKVLKAVNDGIFLESTINVAAGQASPTTTGPINFTATFSKDVTGFTSEDVSLSGTAGATTAVVSGGPKSYTITVSGMTKSGTVIAIFAAGVATDALGQVNLAPTTITGNSVIYDIAPPTAAPTVTDTSDNPISATAAGWYNQHVLVTWNWTDEAGGSGLDTPSCTPSTLFNHLGELTLTVTCNDLVGNQGTSSQTINLDLDSPIISITGVESGATYPSAPEVACQSSDWPSGIASEAVPFITDNGGGSFTATCTNTDNAGNTASASVTYSVIPPDTTAPSAAPSITDTSGNPLSASAAGWYNQQVQVTWNWSDNAGIDTANCTTSSSSSGQGELTLSATCNDVAGNQGTSSVIVKVDTEVPSVSVTGVDNGGSYSSTPSVGCQTTDTTSGIVSEATPVITDNGNSSFSATCTNSDNAGNSSSDSKTYSIVLPDTTPPTASPAITDKSGNSLSPSSSGWYRKQVKVTWNWNDDAGGSGVNAANCTTSTTSVGQGELTLTATCKDVAGNQGNASVLVKVDTVAPETMTFTGAAPASPNAKGWYNTNVIVSFAGTDATSGIASCPNKTMGEGFGRTTTGVCTDNAGNRKTLLSPAFNIDKTKPVVIVLMNGSVVSGTPSYSLAQGIPTASCNTTDALSGVATPALVSIVKVTSSGEVAASNPPTATGTYRARCSGALDNADNANARTVTFKVTR